MQRIGLVYERVSLSSAPAAAAAAAIATKGKTECALYCLDI